jgi:putative hemolysin
VPLWAVLAVIITSVAVSSFADELPGRIAEKNASEKTALKAFPFIKALIILMKPFTFLIDVLSFVPGKIFGVSARSRVDTVTEEEILMMVDAGNETGVIEESQKEMINNIFEFGDVKVSEIMTHRTDIVGLEVNDKIRDIVYLAINKGFSRLPVYDGSIDKIIGIIYVKDFLCLVGHEETDELTIRDFMHEALYIPASNKCDEVFEIMTKKKMQMAVLVDEYGGTAGIVTMEDILEEIVGNIQDEYDEEEQEITKISDDVYMISGGADPEDVLSVLHVKLPESREYDTMNAMVVDLLGRIPTEKESPSVIYENVEFTVMVMEDNWVSKIKAVILKTEENENEKED